MILWCNFILLVIVNSVLSLTVNVSVRTTKPNRIVPWTLPEPDISYNDPKLTVRIKFKEGDQPIPTFLKNSYIKKSYFYSCLNKNFTQLKNACHKYKLKCAKRHCSRTKDLIITQTDVLYYAVVAILNKKRKKYLNKMLHFGVYSPHKPTTTTQTTTTTTTTKTTRITKATSDECSLLNFTTGGAPADGYTQNLYTVPTQPLMTCNDRCNPGRGFYKHSETLTSIWRPLILEDLESYVTEGYTLIYRNIVLDDFITTDISADILDKIDNDFNTLRDAGVKLILRFCYTLDNSGDTWPEADLPQLLRHIEQLGPHLHDHEDVLFVVHTGFVGVWGEWYYTTNYGNPNTGGPDEDDWNNRRTIVNALLEAVPVTRQIQMRTPYIKRTILERTSSVTLTEAHQGSASSRLSHHNDCFLASDTDYGTYINKPDEYNYLTQETKYLIMGGETCEGNSPRSDCSTATKELKELHFTYLNSGYHPMVLASWETDGCLDEIRSSLGYHFVGINSYTPEIVTPGTPFCIHVVLKNIGYASPSNPYNVQVIMKSISDGTEYIAAESTEDPRFWLSHEQVTMKISAMLPVTASNGEYKIVLRLADGHSNISNRPEYRIVIDNLLDESLLVDRDSLLASTTVN